MTNRDQRDQKHPLTLLAVLAVILAALTGTLYMMDRADARVGHVGAGSGAGPIPVDTLVLQRVDIQRRIEARGFFSGIAEVTVASEVPGRIEQRRVSDGQRIEKGDVLLIIDDTFHRLAHERAVAESDRARAQLGQTEARMQQAQAQVQSATAVRDNNRKEYERTIELHADGNAPPVELNRVETALKTSEADLAAFEAAKNLSEDEKAFGQAAFEASKAAVREAHERLQRCTVRAPLSGRVNCVFLEPGEYAMASAPLVELVRLDELKMTVELSGSELLLLDEFDHATLVADAAPDKEYAARLHHIAPMIEPTSKRFRVEFRVENLEESLLSGMYGKVTAHCGTIDNVLRIPREAVFTHYGADSCLVLELRDGRQFAKLRRITVRDVPGRLDELEVLSGLEDGQRVIVTRRRGLHSGVAVKPMGSGESNESESEEIATANANASLP